MTGRGFALVATGGFLGATSRYVIGLVLPSLVSTFVVNVVGCFLIGYLLYTVRLGGFSEEVRLLAATGYLSSFTTYSTFAYDAFRSSLTVASVYVAGSYALGFGAVYAGTRLAVRRSSGV